MALLPDLESAEQAYERACREMLEWALNAKNVEKFLKHYKKSCSADVVVTIKGTNNGDVNPLGASEHGLIFRAIQTAAQAVRG